MPKFYDLEILTQEDLNNLALERNTLKQKEKDLIKYLEDKIKELEEKINKLNIPNVYTHFDIAEMYRDKIKIYQDILERVKNNNYE